MTVIHEESGLETMAPPAQQFGEVGVVMPTVDVRASNAPSPSAQILNNREEEEDYRTDNYSNQ